MELDGPDYPRKRHSHKLGFAREKRIREMYLQEPRIPLKEIAASAGGNVSASTILRWCDFMGLPRRGRGRLTPEVENKLRAIIAERPLARRHEICDALGITVHIQTLRIWCQKLQLPLLHGGTKLTGEIAVKLRAFISSDPIPTFEQVRQALGGNLDRRTVTKWCRMVGVSFKRSPLVVKTRLTPEVERKIRECRPNGGPASITELVTLTGNIASRRAMKDWCRRLGVAWRPEPKPSWGCFTPAVELRLRELLASNPVPNHTQMAQVFGVSAATVRRWIRGRLKLPPQKRGPNLNSEIAERLRLLIASSPCATCRELSLEFGVHPTTIWNWFRRLGIKPQKAQDNNLPESPSP